MKAKFAIPLLAIVAIAAGIAGAITGVVFLIVLAVVGLIAAIVGAFWVSRKIKRVGSDQGKSGSAEEGMQKRH